jgi:hypothetical protein
MKHIQFDPKINQENFRTFWSCGQAWGNYKQTPNNATIEVNFGKMSLETIKLPMPTVNKVLLNNNELAFDIQDGHITFTEPVSLEGGSILTMQ